MILIKYILNDKKEKSFKFGTRLDWKHQLEIRLRKDVGQKVDSIEFANVQPLPVIEESLERKGVARGSLILRTKSGVLMGTFEISYNKLAIRYDRMKIVRFTRTPRHSEHSIRGRTFTETGQSAELDARIADQLVADLPENFEIVEEFDLVVGE